jgi:hypothetical protein
MHTKFGPKNLKERDQSEELGSNGDNIRINLKEIEWEGVDWIHVAQERDQ